MKLSKEQIQQIEDYLNNNDIEYIDLHLEVLDHISSDIEVKMETLNLDFEIAFEKVKDKWNNSFTYKTSYWLGTKNGGSKLFIDYCLRIYKPILFKVLLIFFLIPVSFYLFVKNYNLDLLIYKSVINNIYIGFSILYLTIILFWKFKLKQVITKSTFSYLLNIQVLPNFFIVFLLLVGDSFNSHQEFKYSKLIMFSGLITILIMGFFFYKKHLKVVSNYKKYQLK